MRHLLPVEVLDAPQQTKRYIATTPSTTRPRKWTPSSREQRARYKTLGTKENALFKASRDCWDTQYIDNPHARRANGTLGKKVKMKSPDNIGSLMSMLARLQPKSHSEWEELYLNERHLDVSRTASALREQLALSEWGSLNITKQQALDLVLTRVVDETWTGYGVELFYIARRQMEADAEEILSGNRIVFRKATPLEEKRWGVDVVGEAWHGLVELTQIKPISYFRGKSAGLIGDRIHNQKLNEQALQDTGLNVSYYAYDYNPLLLDRQEFIEMRSYDNSFTRIKGTVEFNTPETLREAA